MSESHLDLVYFWGAILIALVPVSVFVVMGVLMTVAVHVVVNRPIQQFLEDLFPLPDHDDVCPSGQVLVDVGTRLWPAHNSFPACILGDA